MTARPAATRCASCEFGFAFARTDDAKPSTDYPDFCRYCVGRNAHEGYYEKLAAEAEAKAKPAPPSKAATPKVNAKNPTCAIDGCVGTVHKPRRRYCSDGCRTESGRIAIDTTPCPCRVCGGNLPPRRSAYCSDVCARDAAREYHRNYHAQSATERLCDVCDKPLPAAAGNVKRCLGKCREIGFKRTRHAAYRRRFTQLTTGD